MSGTGNTTFGFQSRSTGHDWGCIIKWYSWVLSYRCMELELCLDVDKLRLFVDNFYQLVHWQVIMSANL